jgi:hypothetical protein
MKTLNSNHSQTRVLIFDNDHTWCKQICTLLKEEKIHCDIESKTFSRCISKADKLAFDFAIINYHSLISTGNLKELFEFHTTFKTTKIILIGDREDPELNKYNWPPQAIADHNYGDKNSRDLTELRSLIIQLDELRRKLGNITVKFGPGVESLLDNYSRYRFQTRTEEYNNRYRASLSTMKQELQAVIEALFSSKDPDKSPIAKEVAVQPFVEAGRSSSCMLKLTPKILISDGGTKSAVLKFGPKADISKESENYDLYVEWFLTVDQTVKKINYAESNHFAGLLYSYPGDAVSGYQPFANFIRENSVEKSEDIIAGMFNTKNKHWLAIKGDEYVDKDFMVFQHYYLKHVLHASIVEMKDMHLSKLQEEVKKIERLRHPIQLMDVENKNGTINYPAFSLRLPNPIERLGKNQITERLKITAIHGDLHANNILVDKTGRYFFIDFFYTGFGDIYRDFIELEISIRYDLFSSKEIPVEERFTSPDSQNSNIEKMKSLVNFEKELLKCTINKCEPQSPQLLENPSLLKAFRLIKAVRKYAYENCPEKWPLYFAGLAFSCLKGIKYFYPADVKLYRLIISGLYLDYLDKNKKLK